MVEKSNRCEGTKMDQDKKKNLPALMNSTALALPAGAVMSALTVKTLFNLLEWR